MHVINEATTIIFVCVLLSIIAVDSRQGSPMLLTCYAELQKPDVSIIDPNLCTHLMVIGGCFLNGNGSIVLPSDELIQPYVRLKTVNPQLKILITLTPENEAMSKVVLSIELMNKMLSTVEEYMERNNLDGFDYDWEFPVWSENAKRTDRDGFSTLLQKSRDKFNSKAKKYLLSIAVAAPYTIVDHAYDIEAINIHVDLVQIMNYDFHFYSKYEPFTGFNAPLKAQPYELSVLGRMNSDYSTKYWLSAGLNSSKLVFGMPTYGRGYTLLSPESHSLYAIATGPSFYGENEDYALMCQLMNKTGVTYVWNENAATPYLYFVREWIGFEDLRSVVAKTQYAKELGVAGVMIFALHADDYKGTCGQGKFPLINAVKKTLFS
ncbi:glycosyl hydrolases family 18 domain-containing protein [Ditylenchus destructor]|uniref:Glycosyl hydrolases family 18 domain-containing protein n=1 Tax=Ditylenchus destructor TaxID=166010 RepID=A0AAD4RDL2_9BILA|nr:glycosyl hydrolases family 18 domain-containing protein [Ditylenchus destructor]